MSPLEVGSDRRGPPSIVGVKLVVQASLGVQISHCCLEPRSFGRPEASPHARLKATQADMSGICDSQLPKFFLAGLKMGFGGDKRAEMNTGNPIPVQLARAR